MNFPKTLLFASLCLGSGQLYAACRVAMSPADFGLGGQNLIINKMVNSNVRQIAKDAQPAPGRHGTIFNGCSWSQENRTSNSFFTLTSNSNLDTNDIRILPTLKGDRTFLAVKQANYVDKPAGAPEPKVYMSFAVTDPKHPEHVIVVSEPNHPYRMLKTNASTGTLGLVIEKIYLYIITDKNSVPGRYSLGNIVIGELTAKTYSKDGLIYEDDGKAATVRIAPSLTFQIKQSTCALDNPNQIIKLDTVLGREFTSINQTLKTKDLNISMKCPDEIVGINFNATVTDNNTSQAKDNELGILTNQIPVTKGGSNVEVILLDQSNQPMQISSQAVKRVFKFGTLGNSKQIVYPMKVGYHATKLPVTPGDVRAVANINVDYN